MYPTKNQAIAGGLTHTAQIPSAAVPISDGPRITVTENTMVKTNERLYNAYQRLLEIRNRLEGHPPEGKEVGGPAPVPNGHLARMEMTARATSEMTEAVHNILNEIENLV